jgi:hypothetical protein
MGAIEDRGTSSNAITPAPNLYASRSILDPSSIDFRVRRKTFFFRGCNPTVSG